SLYGCVGGTENIVRHDRPLPRRTWPANAVGPEEHLDAAHLMLTIERPEKSLERGLPLRRRQHGGVAASRLRVDDRHASLLDHTAISRVAIGIEPVGLAHLLEAAHQARSARRRRRPDLSLGSRCGLAAHNHHIALRDGRVECRSRALIPTTFAHL